MVAEWGITLHQAMPEEQLSPAGCSCEESPSSAVRGTPELLWFEDLPSVLQYNRYVRSGYRAGASALPSYLDFDSMAQTGSSCCQRLYACIVLHSPKYACIFLCLKGLECQGFLQFRSFGECAVLPCSMLASINALPPEIPGGAGYTWKQCVRSIFQYHNETGVRHCPETPPYSSMRCASHNQ